MLDYPDALNIRKLAFALAFGPLALLLLFGVLDVSTTSKASKASKTEVLPLSEQSCVTSDATLQECLTKVEAKK